MRKKAQEIEEITAEIKQLAQDLIETMLKSEREAVGLAAPQVGISKRIFAAQTESGPTIFINPKITKKSKKTETIEEGCLSLPAIWFKIKRPKEIEMEALDINGKKLKIKTEGMFARILQHEIEHLNGVLIINRVNFWQRITKGSLTK